MSTPAWAPVGPQASNKEEVPLLREVGPGDVDALRAAMSMEVLDVVSREDVEHLEPGDKLVSGSGTVREVVEKKGLHFVFNTTRSYQWSTETSFRFRRSPEKMAANMRSIDLFKLAPGTIVYGPGGEEMTIKSIIWAEHGPEKAYGIVVTFREETSIELDTIGRWLNKIIKKDTTGE